METLNSDDVVGTVTVVTPITREFVNDLMCTAFDGGVGGCWYWIIDYDIQLNGIKAKRGADIGVEYFHDVIAAGGQMIIIPDEYGEEGQLFFLTMDKVIDGIQNYCDGWKKTVAGLMDDHDAIDADCIVQLALFGELVYG